MISGERENDRMTLRQSERYREEKSSKNAINDERDMVTDAYV